MIKVEEVNFTYPSGIEALHNVTLEIQDREFVAVMGENGAGKSTLIRHFNGLLKPSKGEVYIDGVNTRKASVAELSRNVGLVFQNPDHQLFCETVEEEVAFGMRNFGFKEDLIADRVEKTLEFLDLTRYKKSSPFMLSGGERKRVALAAVLAWDPKIMVIDEPTIGQDYAQKEKLRQFVIKLNAQGRTVIMVTHDVEFVADCAPRVVVMSGGRVVDDGSAREILTDSEGLLEASIIPPQITQVLSAMSDLGLKKDVIDILEAEKIIENLVRWGKASEGL
ncbi:MAG: ATP-binding cassette domain-containing protein [Candidatus Bathyarchaeota archaeon]